MVDIASQKFALKDKRPTDSRISVITGLTRHQVRHYREIELEQSPVQAKTNRATRVLTGWLTDPSFQENGQPITLKVDGLGRHFQELTQKYAGDVPHKAILDELLAMKSVELEGNVVRLFSRGFVPNEDECALLEIIGEDSAAFLATLEHNLSAEKGKKWYQKKVSYGHLSYEALVLLRKNQARRAQELLESFNVELDQLQKESQRQAEVDKTSINNLSHGEAQKNPDILADKYPLPETRRAGWGIYYFEAENP